MSAGDEEPRADAPTVDAPAVDEPAVDAPAVDAPAVDAPAVDAPAVDEPAVDVPTVDEPAVDVPAVDEPAADASGAEDVRAEPLGEEAAAELCRVVEALLFLSPEPVPIPTLADACEVEPEHLADALAALQERHAPGAGGLQVKEVAGGYTLATDPVAEAAARRLLARPRTPPLTPAQAETLAIVAYLQPVSRPEITRIRGVSADSAAATLLERGLVEEHGRSQFGAVLYRTTPLFLKLFGLTSPKDLPDVSQWDPTPEETADLRDRLLRAGEARTGGPGPGGGPQALPGVEGDGEAEPDGEAQASPEPAPEPAPGPKPMLAPAPAPAPDGSPED